MADPTTLPPAHYRLRWSRRGYPLALVTRAEAHLPGATADADLVAADDVAPVGTLQTFRDADGALRGRLSLREPLDVDVTFVRPKRLHQAVSGTGAGTAAAGTGAPSRLSVVAEFTDPPRFLRLAISGVTAPLVTKYSDTAVTVALAPGEYFTEVRPAQTEAEANVARPLNRRTHHLARPTPPLASPSTTIGES
ncbi:hypothetical protein C5B96_11480 [Subtercola sp. Z020]|uniref:hypothetical protein n=1 Tax=Subtercola sp. Z020 TaxID=2080582 RepID=UPI000CE7BB6E|nr:hypothetical protein [Subtercola sp. Z020]PPF79890.1 hypothetical protein C5B96_11480 [Subtercola sp. Z020]